MVNTGIFVLVLIIPIVVDDDMMISFSNSIILAINNKFGLNIRIFSSFAPSAINSLTVSVISVHCLNRLLAVLEFYKRIRFQYCHLLDGPKIAK